MEKGCVGLVGDPNTQFALDMIRRIFIRFGKKDVLVWWLVTPTPTLQFTFSLLLLPIQSCTLPHCSVQQQKYFFFNFSRKMNSQPWRYKLKLGAVRLNTHGLVQVILWRGDLMEEVHTHKSEEGIRTNLFKGRHI